MRLNVETPIHIGIRERSPIRFTLIFPFGQLVLCALLLWPIRMWIFADLGVPPRVLGYFSLPHEHMMMGRIRVWSSNNAIEVAALLNLPAGMLQLPYAIFSPNHGDLRPQRVDFKVWRAVTWPIWGTFFWWSAGRGAEAIFSARRKRLVPRIRWVEAVIGFVFLASGVTFAVAFVLTAGEDRHDQMMQALVATALFWAFLGALPFVAKIKQRCLRKELAVFS